MISEYVGKTVDHEVEGRGIIVDETENSVGVRYDFDKDEMKVHYIPKTALEPVS